MTVFLESNAVLDRDFVLNLDGLAGQSFAKIAPDSDEYMVLASFFPELPAKDAPLLLKILVDCSGSMSGNSIESAKYALGSVIKELKANDYISYSRFGSSDVRHEIRQLCVCSTETIHKLSLAVENTDADLRGHGDGKCPACHIQRHCSAGGQRGCTQCAAYYRWGSMERGRRCPGKPEFWTTYFCCWCWKLPG